jgi:hypothetical protein
LRQVLGLIGFYFGFVAFSAQAADVCGMLTTLLTNPPSGFINDRAERIDEKFWSSQPLLESGACRVWASTDGDGHEIRCSINNHAPQATVDGFYKDTAESVDRCLAARPDPKTWQRAVRTLEVESMTGKETSWVFNDHTVRFKIELSADKRTHDGSFYNEFDVEFLKY